MAAARFHLLCFYVQFAKDIFAGPFLPRIVGKFKPLKLQKKRTSKKFSAIHWLTTCEITCELKDKMFAHVSHTT